MFLESHTVQAATHHGFPSHGVLKDRIHTAPFTLQGKFPCRWTQSQSGDGAAGKRWELPVVIKVHEPVPLSFNSAFAEDGSL